MKLTLTVLFSVFSICLFAQNNIGVNNSNPPASAALMVDTASTGPQGMLVPRMTQARRDAIATPATGLMIYQTDNTPGFYYYNGTAWTAVSGGGSLPSQTGNAGKFLKTDGTNPSWGSVNGYELNVSKTASEAQTTSVGSSLVLPDIVNFTPTNGSNAALTGGNTWDGNKFTVSAGGAGFYLVDVTLISTVVAGIPMIDINNSGNSSSSYYGIGQIYATTAQNPHKGRGQLQKVMYLSAGDFFQIRCTPSTTVQGTDLSTDGTTLLRIVKLR